MRIVIRKDLSCLYITDKDAQMLKKQAEQCTVYIGK